MPPSNFETIGLRLCATCADKEIGENIPKLKGVVDTPTI